MAPHSQAARFVFRRQRTCGHRTYRSRYRQTSSAWPMGVSTRPAPAWRGHPCTITYPPRGGVSHGLLVIGLADADRRSSDRGES